MTARLVKVFGSLVLVVAAGTLEFSEASVTNWHPLEGNAIFDEEGTPTTTSLLETRFARHGRHALNPLRIFLGSQPPKQTRVSASTAVWRAPSVVAGTNSSQLDDHQQRNVAAGGVSRFTGPRFVPAAHAPHRRFIGTAWGADGGSFSSDAGDDDTLTNGGTSAEPPVELDDLGHKLLAIKPRFEFESLDDRNKGGFVEQAKDEIRRAALENIRKKELEEPFRPSIDPSSSVDQSYTEYRIRELLGFSDLTGAVLELHTLTDPFMKSILMNRFKVRVLGTLGIGGSGVVFLVEIHDRAALKALGGTPHFALKVLFTLAPSLNSKRGRAAARESLDRSLKRELLPVRLLRRSLPHLGSLENAANSCGWAVPTHVATVLKAGHEELLTAGELAAHPRVILSPTMLGDLNLLFYKSSKEVERVNVLSSLAKEYICFRIISSVSALHTLGYCHRDVKPHNLLIRHDGSVLLTDFGSAGKKGELLPSRFGISTPYMDPQHAKLYSKELPAVALEKYDTWAAGMTCLQIFLDGQKPWKYTEDGTPRAGIVSPPSQSDRMLMNQPPFSIEQMTSELVSKGINPLWISLVSQMLQADRKSRPSLRQITSMFPTFESISVPVENPQN